MDTHELLNERGSNYGDTHVIVGIILHLIREPFIKMLLKYPELVHDYVLMMSKLIRIVFSPTKLDHYDDLIGYATLAKETVERSYTNVTIQSTQQSAPSESARPGAISD